MEPLKAKPEDLEGSDPYRLAVAHQMLYNTSRQDETPARPRPSHAQQMLAHARLASARSTCPRGRVGAVLARGDVILSVGYSGAPRGLPHCDESGCVVIPATFRLAPSYDATVEVERREYSRHAHAEGNCIADCARRGVATEGAACYVTRFPCLDCAKLLIQAGICRVLVPSDEALKLATGPVGLFLEQAGVEVGFVGEAP